MSKGYFEQIHPILPVRDMIVSLQFYVEKLGFEIAFAAAEKSPKYTGIRKDNVEIHLQYHSSEEWKHMSASSLRFVIQDIEGLFDFYKTRGVFHDKTSLKKTPWKTQEFAFYDPDRNGLTFYKDL